MSQSIKISRNLLYNFKALVNKFLDIHYSGFPVLQFAVDMTYVECRIRLFSFSKVILSSYLVVLYVTCLF